MQPDYSRAAEADILDIWLHLAEDSLASADRVLKAIRATCERAVEYPLTGAKKPEFTAKQVRFYVARPFPYFVIYDPARTPPRILRVIHTARDVTSELD